MIDDTTDLPSAGLPRGETALFRLGLKAGAAVLSDRAGAFWLRREAERVAGLARIVPPDAAGKRIRIARVAGIEDHSTFWSAWMVLEHLAIVNDAIRSVVEDLAGGRTPALDVRIENLKPAPAAGPDALDRFLRSTADLQAAVVYHAPLRGRRGRHAHPWFGPLTAHQWHLLAAAHHRIHRRHLQAILRRLEKSRPES